MNVITRFTMLNGHVHVIIQDQTAAFDPEAFESLITLVGENLLGETICLQINGREISAIENIYKFDDDNASNDVGEVVN